MRFNLTSDRAGVAWLGLLALSLVAFPWYKGASLWTGPTASALVEAMSGHGWLWPMIAAAVALGLTALTKRWQQSNVALWLTLGAIILYLWQGFAVGLRGPSQA